MLLAKSRPIVVIGIADGSHFARERLTAFTPWHLDAVSGSHPPHLFTKEDRKRPAHHRGDAIDPTATLIITDAPALARIVVAPKATCGACKRLVTSRQRGSSASAVGR